MPADPSVNAASDALGERRGRRIYGAWNPSNFPIPRLRWGWDGPNYSWITAEIACKWSDPVIGVTWELPSRLSRRVDAGLLRLDALRKRFKS